ncbi:uncharacterized protein LOC133737704 [Rosa rugosa]|uniref:uncharacterized protein LOC133737704 n=1 Tax=Rosa rugosa TaxID=74645 RepID=UPI002B40734F|nr:uncharacterized protein LOC133737704 [Rosa rugosa]
MRPIVSINDDTLQFALKKLELFEKKKKKKLEIPRLLEPSIDKIIRLVGSQQLVLYIPTHLFSLGHIQPSSDFLLRLYALLRSHRQSGVYCICDLVSLFQLHSQFNMSRGNQRDRDRERAQSRSGNKTKQPKTDGLTPEQRRERDAKALQEKAAKKAAQAAGGNKAGGINAGGKK